MASALALASASAQLSTPKPVEDLRFGVKADNTIALAVGGDVAHPGTYHVQAGFGLKSILGLVGGFAWSGHRTHIDPKRAQFAGTIEVIHKKTPDKKSVYAIKDIQRAGFGDIELQEGDAIYFRPVILYEE